MNSITYMSASVNLRKRGCALQGTAAAQRWLGLSPRTGVFCSLPVAPRPCQIATLSRPESTGSGTQDQTLQKKGEAMAMGHAGHFPWGNW